MPLIYSIIAPLIIISSVAVYQGEAFSAIETARLLQNCMLIAGIGTLLQLYPIWKIGSGLPVVMGISFTFLAACLATASQDYGIMVGAIIVGGCFEGVLGLTAKYWRKIISPIVSACVVVSIGLSILNVGVSSFGSSSAYPLGSWQNLLVATITLAAALSGGVFGCSPITSFSQNVGLISMTHVVNRFTIMFGGLFPPIGAFFTTLPNCVLGGCTVIMFGSIMMSGVRMMHDADMDQRNTLIAATSICLGVGVTQANGFFNELPSFIGDIFRGQYGRGRVRRGPDPRSVSAARPQPLYQHVTQIFGIQKGSCGNSSGAFFIYNSVHRRQHAEAVFDDMARADHRARAATDALFVVDLSTAELV